MQFTDFRILVSVSDVSSNNIVGEIPFGLPRNATHM